MPERPSFPRVERLARPQKRQFVPEDAQDPAPVRDQSALVQHVVVHGLRTARRLLRPKKVVAVEQCVLVENDTLVEPHVVPLNQRTSIDATADAPQLAVVEQRRSPVPPAHVLHGKADVTRYESRADVGRRVAMVIGVERFFPRFQRAEFRNADGEYAEVRARGGHLADAQRQELRLKRVVAVQEEHVLAPRNVKAAIARTRKSAIGLVHHAHAWIRRRQPFQYRARAVRRAVIHGDDLKIGKRATEDAVHRVLHPFLHVPAWNDYACRGAHAFAAARALPTDWSMS